MLAIHIFAALAVATGVFADLLDTPQGSSDYSYVGPMIDANTGYSKDQVDQIHQASNDAVLLAKYACNAERNFTFNRVFKKYFDPGDADYVINVLNQVLNHEYFTYSDTTNIEPSKPKFDPRFELRNITVVADYPYGIVKWELACSDDGSGPGAVIRDTDQTEPKIVVCPQAFKYTSSFPIPGAPTWPDVPQLSCDLIGENVSEQMSTMGTTFLGLYIFWSRIMGDALKDNGGNAVDVTKGPKSVLELKGESARANADNYVWFATELAWTLNCGRPFGRPV